MKINIPIYNAKKIHSDDYVEGYYHPNFFMCMGNETCGTISTKDGYQYEIDPSTLVISFDDGENWILVNSIIEEYKDTTCNYGRLNEFPQLGRFEKNSEISLLSGVVIKGIQS